MTRSMKHALYPTRSGPRRTVAASLGALLALAAVAVPAQAATVPALVPAAPEVAADEEDGTPDPTVTLPLDYAFTVGGGSSYTISFQVPEGMTPVSFHSSMESTANTELRVLTAQRSVGVVPTSSESFELPLEARDVNDQGRVALTLALPPGTWCEPDLSGDGLGYTAVLSDAAIELAGDPELPATVADFLGTGVLEVQVDVDEGSLEPLAEAALNMVTSASVATGGKPVELTVGGTSPSPYVSPDAAAPLEVPSFAKRRIELVEGEGQAVAAISAGADGVPTLSMTGSPAALVGAGRAFAEQGIVLANSTEVAGLSASRLPSPRTELSQPSVLTLSELGMDRVSLEGYGRQDAYIPLSQGAFNRSVSRAHVTVRGIASSTSGTTGTVQFLWDGQLVDSFVLDPAKPAFQRQINLDIPALTSGGYLVMRLQAVAADNKCIDESLLPPVRVDIHTDASSVEVSGHGLRTASFQSFPQSFQGRVDLAFGEEVTAPLLSATGELLATLQRATPRPMAVTVVTASDLVGGHEPGILVAGTTGQLSELETAVYSTDPVLINDRVTEVTVQANEPYATLQALRHHGRPLLLLGANPGEGSPDRVLMTVVSGLAGTGWWQLGNDLRLATEGNQPVVLDTRAPTEPGLTSPIVLWGGGALLLVLVAGLVASVTATATRKREGRSREETGDTQI